MKHVPQERDLTLMGIHEVVDLKDPLTFIAQQTQKAPNIVVCLAYVTPAAAQVMLEANHQHQRNLKDRSVARIVRDLENDNWEWNGDFIKFDAQGNLIDGQHRLQAIINAGQAILTGLIFNLEDALPLQDQNRTNRTVPDILTARGVYIPDRHQAIATGRKVLMWLTYGTLNQAEYTTKGKLELSPNEVADWVIRHQESLKATVSYLFRLPTSMGPHSVYGALHYILSQWGEDRTEIADFFEKLVEPIYMENDDPLYQLHRRLNRMYQLRLRQKVRVPDRQYMALLIKTWNMTLAGVPARQMMSWGRNESFPSIGGLVESVDKHQQEKYKQYFS